MSPSLWRSCALVAIVLVFGVIAGDTVRHGPQADFGFTSHSLASERGVYQLDTVDPHGAAARAGLQTGDRLTLVADTYAERMRYARAGPGEPITFRATRLGRERIVTIIPGPDGTDSAPLRFVYEALRLTFLCVATLLALRRPERADARALSNFLIAYAFFLSLDLAWLPAWTTLPVRVLAFVMLFYATEQAARFATLFPVKTSGGLRGAIGRANPYVCVVFAALSAFAIIDGLGFGNVPPALVLQLIPLGWLYFTVAITLAFVIGNRHASGEDKQRGRWVSISLAAGFSGLVVLVVCEILGRTDPWLRFMPLTMVAIPVGTGYSILRHRVMDIGFALNRALVFTTLSAGVILAFSILEWLLGRFLTSAGHVTSAALELGVALVVGLSLQRIHKAIDGIVDDVFFRERHRAVRALHRSAFEAGFVTDADVLLERTHAVVVGSLRARGCAIYVADESGSFRERRNSLAGAPASLDPNDALIVTLRAFRTEADIDPDTSRMPGESAFPMIVRGDLLGLFVCGSKPEGDALAPDERGALAALALATGNVLDALNVRDLKRAVAEALASETTAAELRARLRLLELVR